MIDIRSKIGGIKPSFLMRKLLIPILAALASPTTVNAETVWLILEHDGGGGLEKIEMESLEQCEEQGYIFQNKTNILIKAPQKSAWTARGNWKCLIGK